MKKAKKRSLRFGGLRKAFQSRFNGGGTFLSICFHCEEFLQRSIFFSRTPPTFFNPDSPDCFCLKMRLLPLGISANTRTNRQWRDVKNRDSRDASAMNPLFRIPRVSYPGTLAYRRRLRRNYDVSEQSWLHGAIFTGFCSGARVGGSKPHRSGPDRNLFTPVPVELARSPTGSVTAPDG